MTATMPWEYRVQPGGRIQRFSADDGIRTLRPGEVRLEFLAGGICGSDTRAIADLVEDGGDSQAPIAPIHEVAGRVVDSKDDRLVCGQTVVGTCLTGLASTLIEQADHLIPVPPSLSPTDAVAIQPISTVLRAARGLPSLEGRDVVVLGTGPIGLAFVHLLARSGTARVTAVDPVAGRSELARRYGADQFLPCTGERWSRENASTRTRPSLVIDAVGRRPGIIAGALRAVADGGLVLGFGGAGRADYPIPFHEMYHRRLTLMSGRVREGWLDVLDEGARYLQEYRGDFADYVSDRFSFADAQAAYALCSEPNADRVKVVLESTA